ncbi:hypothetical protein KUL42_00200 [Alteromonas sp. KUL42]|uniref:Ig-like domain-containing protein n=1 Tax=Alteromonas sp. KUL42 TaxID=2480797 RepID=UPI0010365E37|nr:Ig-like domain-containing protein [Alteromonas sp. KUL42]TAP38064.1 tandem-95 repeat protein [Alteromonas sp. KUL42]GEA05259.1 hypothetical protein KUL42_00200 [Alteromonas sp. KUL42]
MEPMFMLVTKLLKRVSVEANTTPIKIVLASLALFVGQSNAYAQATTCAGGLQESTTSNSHTIMCTASDFSISSSVTIVDSGFGLYTLSELNNATATDSFGTPVSENEQLIDATCYEFTSTDSATSGAVYSATVFDNVGFTDVNEASCSGGGGGPGPGPGPGTIPDAPVVTSPTSATAATYVVSGTHPVDGTIISVVIDSNNNGLIDVTEFPATGAVSVIGGNWSTAPIAISSTTTFLVVANDPISGLPSDVVAHTVVFSVPNTAPIANNMMQSTDEDTPLSLTFDVSDSDGDDLAATIVTQPQNGSVIVDPNSINATFTPNENFNGTATFTYSVSDGAASSNTATVTIVVDPVNDAPTISGTPDTVVVAGNVYSFQPTIADVDVDNLSELTITSENVPSFLMFDSSDGSLSGQPSETDVGTYSDITITVTDNESASNELNFKLEVVSNNTAPIANNMVQSTDEDTPLSLTFNVSDSDGDNLAATIVTQPLNGSVTVVPNSITATFTPNENFHGTATFTYSVSDGAASSNTATVTIVVDPVNDAPTISGTPDTVVVAGNVYSFQPTIADVDVDNLSELTITSENVPSFLMFDSSDGSLSGQPSETDVGTYSDIAITVSDNEAAPQSLRFTLEVVSNNAAPVANDMTLSTDEDTPLSLTFDVSDSDGDDLAATIVTQPQNGSVIVDPNSINATFTPNENFHGTATFTYSVSDGAASSNTATVTIVVDPVNDAPTISGTPATSVNVGNEYSFTPEVNDIEDGKDLTFSMTHRPIWMEEINPITGEAKGTPGSHDVGTYQGVTITVTDKDGGSDSLEFFIEVLGNNTAPVISGTPPSTIRVGELFRFQPIVTDAERGPYKFTENALPTFLNINETSGLITGTPTADDVGITSGITITVTDSENASDQLTFDLEVKSNSAPSAGNVNVTTSINTPILIGLTGTDPDSDDLIYSIDSQPGNGSVVVSSEDERFVTYTPTQCFIGQDSFTYNVSDRVLSDRGTVNITVSDTNLPPVNDRPLGSVTKNENDTTFTFEFGLYFYDPNNCGNGTLTYTFSENIDNLVEDYTFEGETAVFTLDGVKNGTEQITVTVTNSKGLSITALWTLTIEEANDRPEWSAALDEVINLEPDETVQFNMSEYVQDEESNWANGSLQGTAISSNPDAASANIQGALLSIAGLSGGESTVTVTVRDNEHELVKQIAVFVEQSTSLRTTCEDELELTARIDEAFRYSVNQCFENAESVELSDVTWADANSFIAFPPGSHNCMWAQCSEIDNNFVIQGTPSAEHRNSTLTLNFVIRGIKPESILRQKIEIKTPKTIKPEIIAPDKVEINAAGAFESLPFTKLLSVESDDDVQQALEDLVISGQGIPKIVSINGRTATIDVSFAVKSYLSFSLEGYNELGNYHILTSGKYTLGWQLETPNGEKSDIVYQDVWIWPQYTFDPTEVFDGQKDPSFGTHALSGVLPEPENYLTIQYSELSGTCVGQIAPLSDTLFNSDKTELTVFGEVQSSEGSFGILGGDYCKYSLEPKLSETELYPNNAGIYSTESSSKSSFSKEGNVNIVARFALSDTNAKPSKVQTTNPYILSPQNIINGEMSNSHNNFLTGVNLNVLGSGVDLGRPLSVGHVASESKETKTPNPIPLSTLISATDDSAIPIEFEQDGADIALKLPANLATGIYQLIFEFIDIEGKIGQSTAFVKLANALPILSIDEDTDGDGLVDLAEGVIDSNSNGIVDYLDNINFTYQLPLHYDFSAVIQCRAGYLCALGPYALGAGGDGAAITVQEWSQLSQTSFPDSTIAISEIYDFTVRDLQTVGQPVDVVVPLSQPIASNAVYSTYIQGVWSSWVEDEFTTLSSSPSDISGVCPSAGAESYRPGLNPGDVCIQLPLVDGGANDADGIANGEIYFTGVLTLANNQLPVLEVDTLTLPINQFGVINVLENDTDPDEHELTLIDVKGDFVDIGFTSDGDVEITPYDDFTGSQLLRYIVQDSEGAFAESALIVTVEQNQAPVAQNDIASTDDRTSIVIDVLANDTDPEDGALIVDQVQAEHGTVSIVNNQIKYTPLIGFDGVDTILYFVEDSLGADTSAVVEVTVQAHQTVVSENKSGGSIGTGMMALLLMAALIRRRATLLTAVALLAVSHSSLAQGWYTQFEIGQASAEKPAIPTQVSVVNYDLNDTMWGVTLGYQLSESWALESSYLDLGDSRITLEQLTLQPDVTEQELAAIQPLLTQGVTLGARYTLLQKNGWSVSVPLGLYRWKTDALSGSGTSISTKERNGSDWFTGILINVKVADHLQLGANYRYIDLESGKVDTFSLSATYLF